jgi:multidrug efflux pump subunit AcrB
MLSPTLPLSLVNEYAETQLAQRLSTIPGVAQVQIFGSQKFAVRVQANPDQLASRGIGIDELQQGAGAKQRQSACRAARRQPADVCHQGWWTAVHCRSLPSR